MKDRTGHSISAPSNRRSENTSAAEVGQRETGVANETVLMTIGARRRATGCGSRSTDRRSYRSVPVDLLAKAHGAPEHLARNPQGLVPVLDIDGERLTQSLAIIEYLAETRDGTGFLRPIPSTGNASARFPMPVAMDIHPRLQSPASSLM